MVFHTMGTMLGIAVANLINIFNFPLYLLSGGVLAGWDEFAPSMMAEVQKRSFTYPKHENPDRKSHSRQ